MKLVAAELPYPCCYSAIISRARRSVRGTGYICPLLTRCRGSLQGIIHHPSHQVGGVHGLPGRGHFRARPCGHRWTALHGPCTVVPGANKRRALSLVCFPGEHTEAWCSSKRTYPARQAGNGAKITKRPICPHLYPNIATLSPIRIGQMFKVGQMAAKI